MIITIILQMEPLDIVRKHTTIGMVKVLNNTSVIIDPQNIFIK